MLEKLNFTVSSLLASTEDSAVQTPVVSNAGTLCSRLKLNATSLALKGFPSDQVTPCRVRTVRWVGSLQE